MSDSIVSEGPGGVSQVVFGDRGDIVVFEDGSRELVDSYEKWLSERHAGEASERVFDGACAMCGSEYESYLDHLKVCPGDVE